VHHGVVPALSAAMDRMAGWLIQRVGVARATID
jgi:hypothetical protein